MRLKGSLVAGTFIRRDNRFRATVEVRGQRVWAHVPMAPGVALFPDAPTQGGRRHVRELAQAVQEGKRAGE